MILPAWVGALIGAPWVFAFSPSEVWFIGLGQLLALMLWVSTLRSARQAFVAGWAFGLASMGVGVSWLYISLHQYGGLPQWFAVLSLFLFCLYLGLFAGFATAGWHVLKTVWSGRWAAWALPFAFASLWTFFEWFRGYFLSGFAWLSLGDVFVDSPFSGLLPWLGNHGTSFALIWLLAALVWPFWSRLKKPAPHRPLPAVFSGVFTAVFPLLLVFGLSQVDIQTRVAGELKMAGVQTNVDQSIKFDPDMIVANMEKVFSLGDSALNMLEPDGALIFPETVNPLLWSDSPPSWLRRFRDFA
ncbi:MAG: hypothetical protein R3194_13005, partial [Limnobacter sp.]|nr:hypothetical protein [Limnobacter sp.]